MENEREGQFQSRYEAIRNPKRKKEKPRAGGKKLDQEGGGVGKSEPWGGRKVQGEKKPEGQVGIVGQEKV